MRFQPFHLPLLLALTACSETGHSDDCGSIQPAPPPYARAVKVDDVPFGTSSNDIPISRTAGTPRTVRIEYAVQRVGGGWCMGLYTGPLTPRFIGLPQGVSAALDPTSLPATQSLAETQTLTATLTLAPSIPDGRIALTLVSPEVTGSSMPTYTLVLTTLR
ncbi:MAG: hypothetical protein U0P81_02765 [Holophagaceae bacterium]